MQLATVQNRTGAGLNFCSESDPPRLPQISPPALQQATLGLWNRCERRDAPVCEASTIFERGACMSSCAAGYYPSGNNVCSPNTNAGDSAACTTLIQSMDSGTAYRTIRIAGYAPSAGAHCEQPDEATCTNTRHRRTNGSCTDTCLNTPLQHAGYCMVSQMLRRCVRLNTQLG